jgi:pimeloyl-ACP methyl ester carboxylesterase
MQILINDLRIHYKIYGIENEKAVVLLHGWGDSLNSFNPIINYLKEKYKVYAIDLPGFGKSSMPTKPLTIINYTEIIKQMFDELNIEKPILIGHSFGGRIIITLVGLFKYKVDRIVLIDSAGIKPKRTIWYYIKIYTYKFLKLFRKFMRKERAKKYLYKLRKIFGSTDYNKVNETMKRTLSLTVNEDLRKYLKYILVPTLLIWGEKDDVTPLKDGLIMKKIIPDSGLVILKNAGHYSFIDKYYEFKLTILFFLDQRLK